MIKQKCKKHVWNSLSKASQGKASIWKCEKCRMWLLGSEVIQLETLNEIRGYQRWGIIISIILSFLALVASFYAIIFK